ncbi:hypothetical protein RJ55_06139 [Drechmeria coniospora]|nr:hypothetical protein RJ55_06139 [Drechmeria coniospora]
MENMGQPLTSPLFTESGKQLLDSRPGLLDDERLKDEQADCTRICEVLKAAAFRSGVGRDELDDLITAMRKVQGHISRCHDFVHEPLSASQMDGAACSRPECEKRAAGFQKLRPLLSMAKTVLDASEEYCVEARRTVVLAAMVDDNKRIGGKASQAGAEEGKDQEMIIDLLQRNRTLTNENQMLRGEVRDFRYHQHAAKSADAIFPDGQPESHRENMETVKAVPEDGLDIADMADMEGAVPENTLPAAIQVGRMQRDPPLWEARSSTTCISFDENGRVAASPPESCDAGPRTRSLQADLAVPTSGTASPTLPAVMTGGRANHDAKATRLDESRAAVEAEGEKLEELRMQLDMMCRERDEWMQRHDDLEREHRASRAQKDSSVGRTSSALSYRAMNSLQDELWDMMDSPDPWVGLPTSPASTLARQAMCRASNAAGLAPLPSGRLKKVSFATDSARVEGGTAAAELTSPGNNSVPQSASLVGEIGRSWIHLFSLLVFLRQWLLQSIKGLIYNHREHLLGRPIADGVDWSAWQPQAVAAHDMSMTDVFHLLRQGFVLLSAQTWLACQAERRLWLGANGFTRSYLVKQVREEATAWRATTGVDPLLGWDWGRLVLIVLIQSAEWWAPRLWVRLQRRWNGTDGVGTVCRDMSAH